MASETGSLLSAPALKEALAALAGTGEVLEGEACLRYGVDRRTPLLALRPRTEEEVAAALATAARLGAAVVPWGGGTSMGLGNLPVRYHMALDLSLLNSVVEHQPGDLTVTVQAGVTLKALQQALAPHGQFLPLDPPLPERATVGGVLAAAACGPLRAGYGLPRDLVIGMKLALADGTVIKSGGRVVKNVTGYDLHRLNVGALGTLGVILEATFKLAPLPPEEATVVAAFSSVDVAARAGLEAVRSGLAPLAVEVLSAGAWGSVAQDTKQSPGAAQGAHWLLLRFGGRASQVARQVNGASARCLAAGGLKESLTSLRGTEAERLWRNVADLGQREPSAALIVRIEVPPAAGASAAVAADAVALGDRPLVALHAGHGVVRAFWANGVDTAPEAVAQALQQLRQHVKERGGATLVEWASIQVKEVLDVWGDPGPGLGVMRRLKAEYDPSGVLNPGRFVGGI